MSDPVDGLVVDEVRPALLRGVLWRHQDHAGLLVLVIGIIAVVQWADGSFIRSLTVFLAINAIAAIALAPLTRSGEISFAQAAFMGVGAYTTAYLSAIRGWDIVASMAMGVALAGLLGVFLGLIVSRLEGYYLALATLVFTLLFRVLVLNNDALRGVSGITGVPPIELFGLEVRTARDYGVVGAILILAVGILVRPLLTVRRGWDLDAMAFSGVLVDSLAHPRRRTKIVLFGVSAMGGGLAGGLYATYVGFVNPNPFGVLASVDVLLAVFIGGVAAVYGPLLGAIALTVVSEVGTEAIVKLAGDDAVGYMQTGFAGALLIAVVMLFPRGITSVGPVKGFVKRQDGSLLTRWSSR